MQCEADLRAKREAALRSVEVDPALDFQDLLEMLKWHIDLREHQRARSSGTVAPLRAGEDVPRTFSTSLPKKAGGRKCGAHATHAR